MAKVEKLKFRLIGTRPLILHNCQPSLDPFNEMRREIASITGKASKKKTDDDHRRVSELEFHMGLYLDESGGVIMPSANIERMIRDGAAESRQGKKILAGITIPDDSPILDSNGRQYKDPAKLWEADGGARHRFLCPVKVQQARVIRTRPIFRDWQIETEVLYMPEVVNADTIIEAVEIAGVLKCLGDYRPRYGSFRAEAA